MILTYSVGGVHNLFTLCVFISYIVTNHPSPPSLSKMTKKLGKLCQRNKEEEGEEGEEEDEEENRGSNLEVKMFGFKTFWYLILLACSGLGTAYYGYLFSFHLLHLAYFNQLLRRAIQAVTKNGTSLLWVLFFGLLLMLIYALISFAFYRELFDESIGLYCSNIFQCLITMLHRGLIKGTHEFLEVTMVKDFTYHLYKAIYDIIFFMMITTIGLNIIFGIIVDTFSELRDNKWQVDNDMHTCCFICSRNSYDFEHQGGGFEHHVKEEHNQWAYLFFFIHLDETRPNDYTSIEYYISRRLEKENHDFFPLNRALSLQQEEDGNEIRLETLMSQVSYLVTKMKEEEALKEKEEEKKRQQVWEEQHRNARGRGGPQAQMVRTRRRLDSDDF